MQSSSAVAGDVSGRQVTTGKFETRDVLVKTLQWWRYVDFCCGRARCDDAVSIDSLISAFGTVITLVHRGTQHTDQWMDAESVCERMSAVT